MKEKLEYWLPELDGNYIAYSCDMVRISLTLSPKMYMMVKGLILQDTENRRVDVNYSSKYHAYKYLYVLQYKNGGVATMGLYRNDCDATHREYGFIEFNPNKLMNDEQFRDDFDELKKWAFINGITRYDLAIDIPASRENISMLKTDNRKYFLERHSPSNTTEYLGTRHKPGYVKLYNKQKESDLAHPLTRLEVTCSDDSVRIPRVIDKTGLSPVENTIVTLALLNGNMTAAAASLSPYYKKMFNDAVREYEIKFDKKAIKGIGINVRGLLI